MSLKDKKMSVSVRPAMVQNPTGKEFSISFTLWGFETDQFREIMTKHLPAWAELFESKNREYGAGQQTSGTALGVRGQFADIWRKIGKLKTGIWDGNENALTSEGVDEILLDLIGHCFLALWMREHESPALTQREWYDSDDADRMRDAGISPELASIITERIHSGFTSESYEVDSGVWLSAGDPVEFKQHLHRGGNYEVCGFDTQQPDGMVCQIRPLVDRGVVALPIWTNPDWLEIVDQSAKQNMAVDKGCPSKLTIQHIQAQTIDHLNKYHEGESIIL